MAEISEAPNLIRLPRVKAKTGLPRSTIYFKISRNEFPSPINLGERAVAWVDSEVDAWVAARIKASRNELSESAR